jgi:putative membrane protein
MTRVVLRLQNGATMKLTKPICGVVAILSLSAFGCGGSDAPAKDPSTVAIDNTSTTTASTMTPPPNAQDSNMQPQAGDTAPAANPKNASDVSASDPPTISDGDIAAITNAANQGEVDQAKLALKKAKNPKVKKFAQMMIDHHSKAIDDQAKLTTTAKITPSSNAMSQQIGTDGATALSSLQGDSGSDFDKAYIDLQVNEHQQVLTTLDQKLIPSAQNPDLKAALVAFEPKVAEHLKKAQALQAEMSK